MKETSKHITDTNSIHVAMNRARKRMKKVKHQHGTYENFGEEVIRQIEDKFRDELMNGALVKNKGKFEAFCAFQDELATMT